MTFHVQRYSINKHQFLFFQKNKVGLKPFKPYSAHLVTSLHTVCISGKDGQEVVGGVARRVTYTWWLLGLAVKGPWLGLGGPPLSLTAWTGLENTTLRGLISDKGMFMLKGDSSE